jgi:Kdo2-lipid IVA lauroyltransferase/acyltransferase
MKVAGFYIGYVFIWLIALLPLRVLYLFSDLLFFLVFHVTGYRKKVVRENLLHAFPEKSASEIQQLTKKFFRHFCDFLIESLKTIHLSKAQLSKRFQYSNPEIFEKYYNAGKSVVLVSGHYGNWEWMVDFPSKVKHKACAIYKPLQNKKFDKLILSIRQKYAGAAEMVAMNDVYRFILQSERKQLRLITWFLVDQTPPRSYPFWIDFMNREAPFYTGPEKIAQKFGHPVVYLQIKKIRRGYYRAEFIPLCEDPAATQEFEIVRMIVRMLEATIRQQPEYWLWSHRRWKHTRENITATNN